MATSIAPIPTTPERTASWGRRVLVVAGALLLVAWALPMAVSFGPVAPWVASKIQRHVDGRVKVASVSLGWFSPVVLRDVQVRDADGQPLAELPRVATERTLLELVLNPSDPGTIRVEKGQVEVRLTKGRTNVEAALTRAITEPTPQSAAKSAATPPLAVEFVDGSVKVVDESGKLLCALQPVQASVRLLQSAEVPLQATVQATASDGSVTGALDVAVSLRGGGDGRPASAEVKAAFQGAPLALANPALRRLGIDAALAGQLSGQSNVRLGLAGGAVASVSLDGELSGNVGEVTSPLLAETLRLGQYKVAHKLHWRGGELTVERGELTCDLGKASARGSIPTAGDWLAGADRPGQSVSLDLDLTRLAERLPRTLHLHGDLRMTSGKLRLTAQSARRGGDVAWDGELQVASLRGVRGSQVVVWPEPLLLEFHARQLARGVPLVDRLSCRSSFLSVEASSTADRLQLKTEADLDKLGEPLGRFIDLGGVRVAGRASADLSARKTGRDTFLADGNVRVNDLYLEILPGRPWQEPTLHAKLTAAGKVTDDGPVRLDAAHVRVTAGRDEVELRLLDALTGPSLSRPGYWHAKAAGDLGRWQRRAAALIPGLDGWAASGSLHAEGKVRISGTVVEADGCSATVKVLGVQGPGLRLDEPTFSAHGAGRLDLAARTLDVKQGRVECPTASAVVSELRVDLAAGTARGAATVRADVGRLRAALRDVIPESAEGSLSGQVSFAASGSVVTVSADVTVKRFVLGDRARPVWDEDELRLEGQGRYDAAADVAHLQRLRIEAGVGSGELEGRVAKPGGVCDIDVKGRLSYDLQHAEPYLRPYLGDDVKLTGKDTRAFTLAGSLRGPAGELRLTELRGEASLAWQSVQALGADVGPADVRARLQKGWLQVYPLDAALNGGRLKLQPNFHLDPEPRELVLLQGPLVEQAAITPAMCSGALGYVAPALANVTEAEGTVSVSLEGGRVPLGNPAASELKGKLVVHSAKVGPGPLVRELGTLFKSPAPARLARESQVAFHVTGGRVHHRDLELVFPDLTIRTSGSVGFDGSLALLAEMPIPPKLVGNHRLSAALAKQTVRIPVGGTLDNPRVDARALQAISAQLARDLTRDAVQQEIENRLKGLLRPGGKKE